MLQKVKIFLVNPMVKGDKNHAKEKREKPEKKKYTKLVLTKHNKLKDITANGTGGGLGCTKFLF
jgi:hypothetical protein